MKRKISKIKMENDARREKLRKDITDRLAKEFEGKKIGGFEMMALIGNEMCEKFKVK